MIRFGNRTAWLVLLIAAAAACIYLPFLGLAHLFDWDEINFAEISREMLVLENYTRVHVRFLPFWEKPPLFFWLQAAAMKVFGVHEFAARLPNALCGITTLPVLFMIGRKLYDEKFGITWALVYGSSLLPALYFQSGIIDPVYNLFAFLGLYFFILFVWKRRREEGIELRRNFWTYLILGGLFTGLAILTKGPAALLVLCICFFAYWIKVNFKWYVTVPQFTVYLLMALVASGIWYAAETVLHGPWFITEFIRYNYRLFSTPDAGHAGFPGYHFVVVFIGCFPASLFLLKGLFRPEPASGYQRDFRFWMIVLLLAVLILFSIVQSKIVHYSSMTYFPVTFLASRVIWEYLKNGKPLRNDVAWGIRILAILFGFVLIVLPVIGLNIHWLSELTEDPFARENMKADPGWTGWESMAGMLLLIAAFTGVHLMRRGRMASGMVLLFLGTAVSSKLAMILDVPKIEAYSQRAAIDFFKSIRGEDAYVHSVGYKTYADAFYGLLKPENMPQITDYNDAAQKAAWERWLLEGDIDKPAYLITRIDRRHLMDANPRLALIYNKNGFLVYKRIPGRDH